MEEILDLGILGQLLESFHHSTGLAAALQTYPDRETIYSAGGTRVCGEFHRSEATARLCEKNDREQLERIEGGEDFTFCGCPNGMHCGSIAIRVGGELVALIQGGQAISVEQTVESFREQAKERGYEEAAYLSAIAEVVRMDLPTMGGHFRFLAQIAELAARQGLALANSRKAAAMVKNFKLIADNAGYGMAMIEPDGAIIYVNDYFARLHGWEPEELTGMNVSIFHSAGQLPALRQVTREAFENDVLGPVEIMHAARDGREFPMLMNFVVIRDNKGRPVMGATTAIDISARKRHLEELEAARHAAEAANEAKTTFLATMSHELRTPLNGILGIGSILADGELDEEQRDFVHTLNESAEILLALVEEILDLTSIESGRLKLGGAEFDPRQVFRSRLQGAELRARNKGLWFRTDIAGDLPDSIVGDGLRLGQLFANVLNNAVKFTEEGGVDVKVDWRVLDCEQVRLDMTVRDTGIGIPLEQQDSVFDSFSQVDGGISRRQGGLGLGLSVSRQLAELMGGGIELESRVGSGSTFRISVKCRSARVGETHRPGSEEQSPVFGQEGPRILLVEDNAINRKVALKMLQRLGLGADQALDGEEAIERLCEQRYDLVLMDLQLPAMDGLTATRLIRDPANAVLDRKVPIVALTAHALEGDRRRCLDAGMDDYLSKPLRFEELRTMLERVVPEILGRTEPVEV